MKKQENGNGGITLIALVITILVLLILAGVSISMLTGDNSLLNQAANAKEATETGEIEENIKLAVAGALTSGLGTMTETNLKEELTNYFGDEGTGYTITTSSSGWTVTVDGYSYKISSTGTVTEKTGSTTLVEAFEDGEIKVGDWVNYENPTTVSVTGTGYTTTGYTVSASQTGITTENYFGTDVDQTYSLTNNGVQVNWRVLGLSEDGEHLLLTTGTPIQRDYDSGETIDYTNMPYLYLYGAESYEYAIEEMDNICAIYANEYAEEARSITQEDINLALGVTTTAQIEELNLSYYYGWKQYGTTYSFSSQYTPYTWLNGSGSGTISGTVTGYYYSVNSYVASDAPYLTVSSELYDLLFSGTDWPSGKCYWLASRFVGAYGGYAHFGPGMAYIYGGVTYAGYCNMFNSYGSEDGNAVAVRPVVSLKSSVTVDDIQVIDTPDSGEDSWSFSY